MECGQNIFCNRSVFIGLLLDFLFDAKRQRDQVRNLFVRAWLTQVCVEDASQIISGEIFESRIHSDLKSAGLPWESRYESPLRFFHSNLASAFDWFSARMANCNHSPKQR